MIPLLPRNNLECDDDSFFDHSRLQCRDCPHNSIPNRLHSECVCKRNELQEIICANGQKLDGTCVYPLCSSTSCMADSLAVSNDSLHCVPCGGRSTYDENVGQCICPDGWRLLDVHEVNSVKPLYQDCMACPSGTAVINSSMLKQGQKYYTTAGVHFVPDPFVCASCPSGMKFDDNKICICEANHVLVGEVALGPQLCLNQSFMPTITTLFKNVKFAYLPGGAMTLQSIVLSHFYLQAASKCEFYEGDSFDSISACQTLLNLCIISWYDEASAPCKQLNTVSSKRQQFKDMFTITSENAPIDIFQNKENINMKMSLSRKDGFEHNLDFRLVKYSLNGDYLGFEPLNTALHSCFDRAIAQTKLSKYGIPFGKSFEIEEECDLASLLEEESSFYELYLVDKASFCGSSNCMISVPVLISNELDGRDFYSGIATSDGKRYAKRFVLLDNMVS